MFVTMHFLNLFFLCTFANLICTQIITISFSSKQIYKNYKLRDFTDRAHSNFSIFFSNANIKKYYNNEKNFSLIKKINTSSNKTRRSYAKNKQRNTDIIPISFKEEYFNTSLDVYDKKTTKKQTFNDSDTEDSITIERLDKPAYIYEKNEKLVQKFIPQKTLSFKNEKKNKKCANNICTQKKKSTEEENREKKDFNLNGKYTNEKNSRDKLREKNEYSKSIDKKSKNFFEDHEDANLHQENSSLKSKHKEKKTRLLDNQKVKFVDIKKVANFLRKFFKLPKKINLDLQARTLIKRNCDIATYGPQYCAVDEESKNILWRLENRKNLTILVIGLLMLAGGILVQTCMRVVEKRIITDGDIFSKNVMETAFKQIATISIVNVFLWAILQTNLAEILDEFVFGDVIPPKRDLDKILANVEPVLESLFEELFFVAFLLLVWYVLYVFYFQFLTRSMANWLKKVDESNIYELGKEAQKTKKCCISLSCLSTTSKINYFAFRYEFCDTVKLISTGFIDIHGYCFMEYLRASFMKMAVQMLRLPNSSLIIVMILGVSLWPTFSFRLNQEVNLIICLSAGSFLFVVLIWCYIIRIEKKLLPRFITDYIIRKYEIEMSQTEENSDTNQQILKACCPPYKLQRQKSASPGFCTNFFLGTTLPNKHQQLFFFWARTPLIILRLFDATCFCQLVILAWWTYLIRSHPITWLNTYFYSNFIIILIAALHFGILGHVLWTLVVILNTGMLIDTNLLEHVWEINRVETMRCIVELLDTIRIKAALNQLNEEKQLGWRKCMAEVDTFDQDMRHNLEGIWANLDEIGSGAINVFKIYKYLLSTGLTLKSENDVYQFLEFFDREKKGGLNKIQFYALVFMVKKILTEPLNQAAFRELLINKFSVVWLKTQNINMTMFSRLLNEFGIKWTEGKKRYIFELIGGKPNTSAISLTQFVEQLQVLEDTTINNMKNICF